jgi:general secretion pathway protein J
MHRLSRGFTLIELLVAIAVMALMAILSWRGLDGMSRAQTQLQTRADDALALQVGLSQWRADLDAMTQLQGTPALDWDGRVLRITRTHAQRAPASLQVVAWTLRGPSANGTWMRWQSPPLTLRSEWTNAWARAQTWGQTPSEAERSSEVSVRPLSQWQIFFYRGGAWSNPLSSEGTPSATGTAGTASGAPNAAGAAPSPAGTAPDGIRLLLDLPAGQSLNGKISLDWVKPTLTGNQP